MTKIYFAHPEERRETKREEQIIKELEKRGYEIINPFFGQPEQVTPEIVDIDFALIDQCDGVFIWIPKPVTRSAIGTICEFMFSAFKKKKEIIVLHHTAHPFLERFATKIYKSYQNFKKDKPYFTQ